MSQAANRTCGPCNRRCHQGRNCPAYPPREHVLDYLIKVLTPSRTKREGFSAPGVRTG